MEWWIFNLPILSLAQILQRIVSAVVVVGVHGFVVAWCAARLGDLGPRYDGRQTLNPLLHLDLLGLVHAIFFRFTWMPRFAVDVRALRWGRASVLVITVVASAALAGFAALLWWISPVAVTLLRDAAATTVRVLLVGTAEMAIVTAVFHLVPVPPMVGALVWAGRLKPAVDRAFYWTGVGLVVILSLTGVTTQLAAAIRATFRGLLGF